MRALVLVDMRGKKEANKHFTHKQGQNVWIYFIVQKQNTGTEWVHKL